MADVNWSDAQWQRVKEAVNEAFGKASVASALLPIYGPLAGSTETVRNERLRPVQDFETPITLESDHDAVNLKLVNLTVKVELSSEQVADETLVSAVLAFRRAASILAQEEDRIVFEGYLIGRNDSRFVANSIGPQKGLADLEARKRFDDVAHPNGMVFKPANDTDIATLGRVVVPAVVKAIHKLEDGFNPAPFACVLGNKFFDAVHAPSRSLVLPVDRITPLLRGGPLMRCGQMDASTGIVVSLASNAVDIVVGTPPTVQFLQRTEEAKYLFRVYQRFVLRIRDEVNAPIKGFRVEPSIGQIDEEERTTATIKQERELAKALERLRKLGQ
jgi:uncharacterized linocin/CFP29 family protein